MKSEGGFTTKKSILLAWSILFIVSGCGNASADEQGVARDILARVELQRNRGNLIIDGHPVASRHVLPRLYERRAHAAGWTIESLDQLQLAVERCREKGLNPDDYPLSALSEFAGKLRQGGIDDENRPEYDILATDALIRLAYNLFFGKADLQRTRPRLEHPAAASGCRSRGLLHDSPSKSLFDRDARAFSSGCIRVERPLELAERLLNDPEQWRLEKIRAAIDTGKPRTVTLPAPVLLYCWTAQGRSDGSVHFKQDIYRRDPAVLAALEGPFQFRKQSITKALGY